jgi:hypothetical protein
MTLIYEPVVSVPARESMSISKVKWLKSWEPAMMAGEKFDQLAISLLRRSLAVFKWMN